MIWNPTFSADGGHLLIRSIENGIYKRRVVPVDSITGR
jgi:hypothetical protein